ncbi:MAG: hypothetical protein AAGF11_35105 [Myxococcota bacterium]
MILKPLFIYVLPLLLVLAVALVGGTRRLGFWLTLVLSIVLTPIGGFLAAMISGSKQRKPRRKRKPPRTPIPTAESDQADGGRG